MILSAFTVVAGAVALAMTSGVGDSMYLLLQLFLAVVFLAVAVGSAAGAIATLGWHAGSGARDAVGVPLLIGVAASVAALATAFVVDSLGLRELGGDLATWRGGVALVFTLVASAVVAWRRWMPPVEKWASSEVVVPSAYANGVPARQSWEPGDLP